MLTVDQLGRKILSQDRRYRARDPITPKRSSRKTFMREGTTGQETLALHERLRKARKAIEEVEKDESGGGGGGKQTHYTQILTLQN